MSAKSSILVVEGSRTQAERLRLVLQAHNYLVTVTTDGGAALAAARAQHPALVLSGVALAGMDGYELCAALKQDRAVKHIPVVLLTAVTDIEDLLRGLNAQVDYYIAKPYHEEELVARIAAIMAGLVRTIGQPGKERLEVLVRGERTALSPDRLQVVRLLLSTYENYNAALRRNRSLSVAQLQLETQIQQLQNEVAHRAALPEKSAAPLASPAFVDAAAKAVESANGRRVLVADATLVCRTLTTRLLEKLGWIVEAVATGDAAIAARQQHSYAAVLMDMRLPAMGGLVAAARMRQAEPASVGRVPIIAMTAQSEPEERARCLAAGMDDYLAKPLTLEALKRVLAPHLPHGAVVSQEPGAIALGGTRV